MGHTVPVIGQKYSMGCWAAGFAMLHSWRLNASKSIEQTLGKLGQSYIDAYDADTGLRKSQVQVAMSRLGLKHEPPHNPTVQRWLELAAASPLLVVVDEHRHPDLFAVHARVVSAIASGRGHAVTYNDPAGDDLQGSTITQPLVDFVHHYEQLASTEWAGVQIIHY
ncbi:MAG: papain-like cysteine protease family protein [Aquabacterium sp.]